METLIIILLIIISGVFAWNYFRVKKDLKVEEKLGEIRREGLISWKKKCEELTKNNEELRLNLTENVKQFESGIATIEKLKGGLEMNYEIIKTRDLQIIELEKKVAYLTNGWNEKNDVIADFSRRISDYKTMYAQSQMQNTKLENYGQEMYKLNNDMCKKLVMLRIDLEIIESKLLTKTAPFGKGNK